MLDQDDNEIEELNDFTENAEADIEEAEESEIDSIPDFGKSDEMEEEVEDPFFSQGNQEAPFAETETELSDEELQEVPWSDDGFIIDDLAESEDEPSSLPRRRSDQTAQGELELDGGPKGKFEGESPNFHEGEDLDIPPFLRKKRK